MNYHYPPTIQYKEKEFYCTNLYVKGRILYKIKIDPQSLYDMVQNGDGLYQIYVRIGVKIVKK